MICRAAGLAENALERRRLEQAPLGEVVLDRYAGIILGGSDFCVSSANKTPVQQRVETELKALLDEVLERDWPFLGICYGIGIITNHLGGKIDGQYSESISPVSVHQTAAGRLDPLLAGMPPIFHAFVGHKEAASDLPDQAVVLATGKHCPVQLYRIGKRVYASQFHPELDTPGLISRMEIYREDGYFDPANFAAIAEAARNSPVDGSQFKLLANFVALANAV
jgi:GMP synthase (glutamine-hydrolysing)